MLHGSQSNDHRRTGSKGKSWHIRETWGGHDHILKIDVATIGYHDPDGHGLRLCIARKQNIFVARDAIPIRR